jgi:hypothetical protein
VQDLIAYQKGLGSAQIVYKATDLFSLDLWPVRCCQLLNAPDKNCVVLSCLSGYPILPPPSPSNVLRTHTYMVPYTHITP